MRTALFVGIVGVTSLSGCAAIFKGGKQEVRFVAVPERSDVRVDNQYVGETPTTARVDRNSSQNIKVSREGFSDQYVRVQRHPDTPWWVWDILTCAVPVLLCIPLGVDALSGAWFSLDDEVRVKLDPLPMHEPVQLLQAHRAPPSSTRRPARTSTSPTSTSSAFVFDLGSGVVGRRPRARRHSSAATGSMR